MTITTLNNTTISRDRLLTEKDIAALLQISIPTLRRWRMLRTGPAFVKLGALVRYRPEDLSAFMEAGKEKAA